MTEIVLNGEPHPVSEGATVLDLLQALEIDPQRVAVEYNRQILRPAAWKETVLAAGAQLEVVHFVGGG